MTGYDVLVVGAGIGGMESALKLGDMGYRVLLVEKEASVGGKMILLSKVFPTLDCASCISTPKMAASIHHPNVTTLTYSEVDGITKGEGGRFRATIKRKARFVNETSCTGCQLCETACTVAVPDQFNADMVQRRAAYIAFPQAVPKKAVIDRAGSSPCSYTCPAGIQAHGYVSLIRSGEYEKAFQLVLDATPLVGTLGRACYAPCELECTRGSLEGPLPIRRLKRFIADVHYEKFDGPGVAIPAPNGHRVAVVGSGPAGLTAAWQLARKGYAVKIFEAAPKAGGFLRLAIPAYRLPSRGRGAGHRQRHSLGVEIATNAPVKDLAALHGEGYEAVLLATGTPLSTKLGVPGDQLDGVLSGVAFLRAVKLGEGVDLADRRVVVIGGGNVAMDTARTARRLGARDVTVVYRRSRAEMPAHHVEADDTEKEGVGFVFQAAPLEVLDDGKGAVGGLRCSRMAPAAPGAHRPHPPRRHPRQRLRHRLRRDHHGHRHGPRHGRLHGPGRGRSARPGRGRPRDAAERHAVALRRRRRRLGRLRHHARHGPGPAGRPHDRPLDRRAAARGVRPAAPGRRQGPGPGPPEDLPRGGRRPTRARCSARPRSTSARWSCP